MSLAFGIGDVKNTDENPPGFIVNILFHFPAETTDTVHSCLHQQKFTLQLWETKAGVLLQLDLALGARFDTSCLAQRLSVQHRDGGFDD